MAAALSARSRAAKRAGVGSRGGREDPLDDARPCSPVGGASRLGDPLYDPHGSPIPTAAGDIEEPQFVTLADAAPGVTLEIRQVDDRDPEKLRYLAGLGLVPGTRLLVVNRQPFNGPTSVRVGQDLRVVGHELALSLDDAQLSPEYQGIGWRRLAEIVASPAFVEGAHGDDGTVKAVCGPTAPTYEESAVPDELIWGYVLGRVEARSKPSRLPCITAPSITVGAPDKPMLTSQVRMRCLRSPLQSGSTN